MSEATRSPWLEVLAVDDDAAQRHVLNATLHGVARVHFCSAPAEALEAVRGARFDVAILDVHLRRSREDGFDIARGLHEIDPCLEVLLYTGDDSAGVLESALEVRARRRILKASPRAAIVQAVRDCAEETRRNRTASRDATIGQEARRHLEEQTRTVEISRTVADLYRGFFHSLANELTALGVTGAVLESLAERAAEAPDAALGPRLVDELRLTTDANAGALARISAMVRQMTTEAGDLTNENQRAQVGVTLQALAKIFVADIRLRGGLRIAPPEPELVLPVSSTALMNVLRNVVNFLLERRSGSGEARVAVELIDRAAAERILGAADGLLVLNREAMRAERYVRFHCQCEGAALDAATLTAALAGPPEAGRLYALAHLSARFAAPALCRQAGGRAVVELLFPAWS
ncbi:MAG: response regulator [Opitutae bacterium]|nr:response regulator [Opitutae bacterium]